MGPPQALAKGGRVAAVAGKGLVLFDAAGNAVGVVTSASNIVANGPNAGNAVKFLASAAGLGGNYAGLRGGAGACSKGMGCQPQPKPVLQTSWNDTC